jgi:hypothetical protein
MPGLLTLQTMTACASGRTSGPARAGTAETVAIR